MLIWSWKNNNKKSLYKREFYWSNLSIFTKIKHEQLPAWILSWLQILSHGDRLSEPYWIKLHFVVAYLEVLLFNSLFSYGWEILSKRWTFENDLPFFPMCFYGVINRSGSRGDYIANDSRYGWESELREEVGPVPFQKTYESASGFATPYI